MYNLETEFKKFYYNKVVLSKSETTNLRNKKTLNIDRLKSGLDEYNTENNTSYKIAETLEQGSVAMSTVTQNEENDYDIDVAIVFDSSNIEGKGSIAIKNVVVNALKRKCTNFKKEPEAKTNCVRIEYSDNYHIDFAIYRRTKNDDGSYSYEHAGSDWRPRDPRAINNWFKDEVKTHGEKLRQAVRLSKMFCKSRSDWKMPGGLIQSVLCDEKIQNYERLDEMFYYTMEEVKNRLDSDIEVCNPTDKEQSLLLKESDRDKMNNLKNRLTSYLAKLNVLFEKSCVKKDAIEAWYDFFNHDFWTYEEQTEKKSLALSESFNSKKIISFDDTEEYIENIMPVSLGKNVSLNCIIYRDGKYYNKLKSMLLRKESVLKKDELYFYIESTDVYGSYNIFLKVKNVGDIAEELNQIRGDIINISAELINYKCHYEEASFSGEHFVECYIEKNGVCVAKDFLRVPIS